MRSGHKPGAPGSIIGGIKVIAPLSGRGLIDRSKAIMAKNGVTVDELRAVDHDIATGVWPDMTEYGRPSDARPGIYQRVLAADILVLAGPIWLGDNSSVMKRVIERLYACSLLPDRLARSSCSSLLATSVRSRVLAG